MPTKDWNARGLSRRGRDSFGTPKVIAPPARRPTGTVYSLIVNVAARLRSRRGKPDGKPANASGLCGAIKRLLETSFGQQVASDLEVTKTNEPADYILPRSPQDVSGQTTRGSRARD